MSHPKYHRWPRPAQYIDTPEIVSYWPKLQGTVYCIGPAINATWVNNNDIVNPRGTYVWGKQLVFNDGMGWGYQTFEFEHQMMWRMNVFCYIYDDMWGTWNWEIAARVIHMEAGETAYASAGYPYWPVARRPEPWAKEIEIKLNKNPITGDYISLWLEPCTLKDKKPDSYEPNLTNRTKAGGSPS